MLAKGELASLGEVLRAEGWDELEVVTATPTGFERLAWWIASYSAILIMIGLGGGYFELKTPGFGIGGVVSLIAFGLFFVGNYLAGNMAGYEVAAIFVLGIVLILIEAFVLPGFGVSGISGLLLVVGSLVFSMLDGFTWKTYQWEEEGSVSFGELVGNAALNLAFGIVGFLILLTLLMKYLPQFSFIEKTLLSGALERGNGDDEAPGRRVGLTGLAISDLRPGGLAEIGGEQIEVLAEGVFIKRGKAIRVISEDGMAVTVEEG